MNKLAGKLEELVDSEKIYLESSFKQQKQTLASRLNISQSELNELVKAEWNLRFKEWINLKRIGHAKSMLASAGHADLKIISVAFECGFQEINAFNHLFKEHTGMTPTEYRAFHIHFKRVVGVRPEEYGKDD